MGYSIFIERENTDISLEEWENAVSTIDGIKLSDESVTALNPKTGETISISGSEGDVIVLFKTKGFLGLGAKEQWEKAIYFNNGRAEFNATESIESPTYPVHIAVSKLAKILSAKIRGESGEVYKW